MKEYILSLLKIPAAPEPPAGDTASLKVFRAAPGFYRYRLLALGAKQLVGLVGAILFVSFIIFGHRAESSPRHWMDSFLQMLELLGIIGYCAQAVVALLLVRLDYQLRWYMVTDRSLRLREGIIKVSELTMTFANVQNLEITQGPLQKFFGIADLKVQTAGGGAGMQAKHKGQPLADMHSAWFRGVDNAEEIRELILTRLRHYRGAGLGDHDEHPAVAPPAGGFGPAVRPLLQELVAAARELHLAARQAPTAGLPGNIPPSQ